ncbi:MAG TPA: M23 family metallopeptidase, partial [Chitinispirillaceae bacterium]|nr:M23 family metallopeptidase [Chitinispirillaceae bacterium]
MVFQKKLHKRYRFNRKRKIPLIRFVIGLSVVVYIGSQFLGNNSPKVKSDSSTQSATLLPSLNSFPAVPSIADTLLRNTLRLQTRTVKPGDTFFGILSQCNIPGDICNKIHESFASLGFPKIHPGDSLIVSSKDSGNVENIQFLSKCGNWFKASINDSVITYEKKPVGITTYVALINGILETSLSEAMYKHGVSDIITGKFADIFAWDINFFLEPRKGDRFQILFEQKYSEGRFYGYGEILAARYFSGTKMYTAFARRDSSDVIHYFDQDGRSLQKQFLKAPLRYSRISSGFSYKRKHPVLGIVRPHLGIDYAAASGTPVLAAADGFVRFAGRNGGFGNLVILSHGGVYETYYGHLRSFGAKIRTGAHVSQGTIVGTVGATGLATGPHLDYRMKHHDSFVNP